MRGVSVRWSIAADDSAAAGALAQRLRDYVAEQSFARFQGKPELCFKTWRMVPGEWFEGTYVFIDDAARARFIEAFAETADQSPVSQLVGAGPVSMVSHEVVAIVAGEAGFSEAPRGE